MFKNIIRREEQNKKSIWIQLQCVHKSLASSASFLSSSLALLWKLLKLQPPREIYIRIRNFVLAPRNLNECKWMNTDRYFMMMTKGSFSKNKKKNLNSLFESPGHVLQHLPGNKIGSSQVGFGHSFLIFLHCTRATILRFFCTYVEENKEKIWINNSGILKEINFCIDQQHLK